MRDSRSSVWYLSLALGAVRGSRRSCLGGRPRRLARTLAALGARFDERPPIR